MNITNIFLHLINMSITASFVILAVIAVRWLLARLKAPKVFSYALWLVVLFRLVFPFSVESSFSIVPQIPVLGQDPAAVSDSIGNAVNTGIYDAAAASGINSNTDIYENNINADGTHTLPETVRPAGMQSPGTPGAPGVYGTHGTENNGTAPSAGQNFTKIAAGIWLTVSAVLLTYALISSISLSSKLLGARKVSYGNHIKNEIRIAPSIESPFAFGLINPKIYLPEGLSQEEEGYIVLHEQTHINRGDHIVKIAAFAALCVHWFNPLVWLAFSLMNSDMEKSCDEKVIKTMGTEIKKQYSSSLLALSAPRALAGTPLTFSENNVKGRIKNVLGYQQPKGRTLTAATLIVALSFALLSCNSLSQTPEDTPEDLYNNTSMIGKTYSSIAECADAFVEGRIAYHNSLGSYTITDSDSAVEPIVSITLEQSDENKTAGKITAYALDYKLKPSDISKVTFAGGMAEEDGWILGTESMGEPVLIVAERSTSTSKTQSLEEGEDTEFVYLGNDWSGEFYSGSKGAAEVSLRAFLENQGYVSAKAFYTGDYDIAEFTASTGETWKLLLSQPSMKGAGGIWYVERWMDGNGTVYYTYPDTDLSLGQYFSKLQAAYHSLAPFQPQGEPEAQVMFGSIDGLKTDGISPNAKQTALYYIKNQLNHTYMEETAVTLTENASLDDFYEPPTNHFTGYISAFTDEENYFHLDRVQLLTAGKTEARVHPVSGETTVSNEPGTVTIYNPYVEADYMETDDKTVYYLHATENGSTSIFSGSAGTRGLNRCIQGQDIGLERYVLDGLDDRTNLVRGLIDVLSGLGKLLHLYVSL